MNFQRLGISFFILLFFVLPSIADAGFGITPPYVRNSSLTRNSVYEQQILLVRSDPTSELNATISIDAPGFEDWIEVVEGSEFPLPLGEDKVPMTVRVRVPDDADFQAYKGNIRIKTAPPAGELSRGAVNISLGAQVDIDLNVIDKEIFDFRVRRISISDLDEGHKFWWLYFPGKIKLTMLLENTGNVPVAPSEVNFDIYNANGTNLLEETTHTNRIKKIAPFATDNVVAELPTRLPPGSYKAKYEIKNGEDIKQEGEVTLSILPYGSTGIAGYGFMGLSLAHKISVLFPIFTILIIIGLIIFYSRSRRRGFRS